MLSNTTPHVRTHLVLPRAPVGPPIIVASQSSEPPFVVDTKQTSKGDGVVHVSRPRFLACPNFKPFQYDAGIW